MSTANTKHVTLSTEQYVVLGERAAAEAYRLATNPLEWPTLAYEDSDVKVYSRKSDKNADAKEAMLMLVTTLPGNAATVEALLCPWAKYRLQWDDLLEDLGVIDELPNDAYLIRHLVKRKLALSPRESIDALKLLRKDNGDVVFGAVGTTHADYPPAKGYVRTHQYLGGYVLQPLDAETARFSMIFHADLNLPGPRFLSSMADRFKPW
ncbi:START domain protein [Aphelenchoides avenae]|nr:START domain protein [Aphelenchus avenae]